VTSEPASAIRIPRSTFASIVTERLRAAIVNGSLKPGSQLSEVELANGFGVSRGPVREALQRLVQEGLLLSEPHRGVFIPVLTDDDVLDIYLAREALESAAIRSIVANDTSAAASQALDQYVTQMEKAEAAGDWETVGNFDLEFHVALVEASGSQRLQRMFSTVISETRLCLGVLTAADARADLVQEHRQICDLMQEGKIEQALAVLRKHFDDAVITLSSRHVRTDAMAGDGRGGPHE
jgi:DNA-binding GntR family transcriptional regulator